MIKKTLTTLGVTAVLLVPAGTAQAGPREGADLQREVASQSEPCGPGYYPREQYGRCVEIRNITPRPQGVSVGDIVLGAAAAIGLIILW